MKKSYIKLLVLESILLLVILFVNFVMNRLTNYILIGILLLGLLILKLILGHEKERFRNSKDVILTIVIYCILTLLITYLLGIFVSFIKTPMHFNLNGLKNYIIPTILSIIIIEVFREGLIRKSDGSKYLIIMTTIFFIIVDVILKFRINTVESSYSIFLFLAYYLLPSIAKNILLSYICYKVGYFPSIIYRIIMETYQFVVPFIPEFGDYINSIIRLIIPIGLIIILVKSLKEYVREGADVHSSTNFQKVRNGIAIIIIAIIIYLTSGSFKYFTLAVGSGSMEPIIHRGDLIIIEKLDNNTKKNIEIGDVIAYKYNKKIIVHRVIDLYKDTSEIYIYTKGDNNNSRDNYPVGLNMIVGEVKLDIPLLGYPSLFVNENIN